MGRSKDTKAGNPVMNEGGGAGVLGGGSEGSDFQPIEGAVNDGKEVCVGQRVYEVNVDVGKTMSRNRDVGGKKVDMEGGSDEIWRCGRQCRRCTSEGHHGRGVARRSGRK